MATTTDARRFAALHRDTHLLLLPNAWDAASALLMEREGAEAVGTSSAALAWSLGYADGSALPPAELVGAVHRIARVLSVPLTVDIEDGYSADASAVAELTLQVRRAGAAGINLEDGAGDPVELARKIDAIRRSDGGDALFVNARTDVYLRGLAAGDAALAMTAERLRLYRDAGADGVFVPGVATVDLTRRVAASTDLPLNLMAMPRMDDISALQAAGARRISVGPALFQHSYGAAVQACARFLKRQDVTTMFEHTVDYTMMNAALARSAGRAGEGAT